MYTCSKCGQYLVGPAEITSGLCSKCSGIAPGEENESVGEESTQQQATQQQTSEEKGNSYKTSVFVCKLAEVTGWIGLFISGAIFLVGMMEIAGGKFNIFSAGSSFFILGYAFKFFLGSLILIISGQTSRAVLDNTNYSRLMLNEMRKASSAQA